MFESDGYILSKFKLCVFKAESGEVESNVVDEKR